MASDCEHARTYYHYVCDSLGSITHVVAGNEYGQPGDPAGRMLCRYEYDAFGRTVSAEERTVNRYRFTGEQYDAVTGQYYLRARYYQPETGRFTQMDTYHGDGLNLYAYVGNHPVQYVDPEGHEKSKECKNLGVESGSGSDELIHVYRGTDKYAEISAYEQTGHLMSDATRNIYMETGNLNTAYLQSVAAHNSWLKIWGNEMDYVQAHGAFGTELSQAFGLDRTLMSVTTDIDVARRFAGDRGRIFEAYIPKSQLIKQTLSGAGESEYLIRFGSGGFR